MLSLIFAWINRRVNNREAGDLRRHRAHYDVIVMDKNHRTEMEAARRSVWNVSFIKLSKQTFLFCECGNILKTFTCRIVQSEQNIYLYFIPFLHIDMTQTAETLPQVRQGHLFYIINIMAADDLATQGARASATMIFTMLNRINSVPAALRGNLLTCGDRIDLVQKSKNHGCWCHESSWSLFCTCKVFVYFKQNRYSSVEIIGDHFPVPCPK